MASKIRQNDEVVILAGKDKGKSGKITKVLPAEGKVFVEGINLIKKSEACTSVTATWWHR